MRYALLLLLATCCAATQLGCAIRYTESQLARQHGFTEAERRPDAETRHDQRCYSHGHATNYSNSTVGNPPIYCYLLGLYTDTNYEITK